MPLGPEDLRLPGSQPPTESERLEIKRRLRLYTALSFLLGIPGIALQVLGRAGMRTRPSGIHYADEVAPLNQAGAALALIGTALLIAGLCYGAAAKGRSKSWGLMGLLSCIGLIVLYFLGKNCLHCGAQGGYSAKQCDRCGGPL